MVVIEKQVCSWTIVVAGVMLNVALQQAADASWPIGDTIGAVADQLVTNQQVNGADEGFWLEQNGYEYTGSITAGMVAAFERTCSPDCLRAAERGGNFILNDRGGNFFGDDAFALARLSQVDTDPADNRWRTALADFYHSVRIGEGGTTAYIADYDTIDVSVAVFYIAHHVVAAYYVNAIDRAIWRNAVVGYLGEIDDYASFPVQALGVATWALAQTGNGLDSNVRIQGPGPLAAKKLDELPEILAKHQVVDGQYTGSFYWRFDHQALGGFEESGYTEDTIFCLLGLAAAQASDNSWHLEKKIFAAKEAILSDTAIGSDGTVREHLWDVQSDSYYAYSGEMLTALGSLVTAGDLDLDDVVDQRDLGILADNWLNTSSATTCWCSGADLDRSGTVNMFDYSVLANNWLVDSRAN